MVLNRKKASKNRNPLLSRLILLLNNGGMSEQFISIPLGWSVFRDSTTFFSLSISYDVACRFENDHLSIGPA